MGPMREFCEGAIERRRPFPIEVLKSRTGFKRFRVCSEAGGDRTISAVTATSEGRVVYLVWHEAFRVCACSTLST